MAANRLDDERGDLAGRAAGAIERRENEGVVSPVVDVIQQEPRLGAARDEEVQGRAEAIPGDVPSLISPPAGCVFHPRCKFAFDRCTKAEPALAEIASGRRAACFIYPQVPEVSERTSPLPAR